MHQNPFRLQLNLKKFYQGVQRDNIQIHKSKSNKLNLYYNNKVSHRYGIIKQIAQQLQQKLQQKRIFQASNKIRDTIKSRKLTHTKKQALSQIIQCNREITMSKLNIKMHKDQIKRLQAQEQSSQTNLALQKNYFKKDCEAIDLIQKNSFEFLITIKQNINVLKKLQLSLIQQQNKITNQLQRSDINIFKFQQQLKYLQEYKLFVNLFLGQNQTIQINPGYITQAIDIQQKILFQPIHLIQHMNLLTQRNLIQVQSEYDLKQQLDQVKKQLNSVKNKSQILTLQYEQKKSSLKSQYNNLSIKIKRMSSKNFNYTDTQLDMQAISQKIIQIYKQMFNKQLIFSLQPQQVKSIMRQLENKMVNQMLKPRQNFKRIKIKTTPDQPKKVIGKRKTRIVEKGPLQRLDIFRTFLQKKKKPIIIQQVVVQDDTQKYFN